MIHMAKGGRSRDGGGVQPAQAEPLSKGYLECQGGVCPQQNKGDKLQNHCNNKQELKMAVSEPPPPLREWVWG